MSLEGYTQKKQKEVRGRPWALPRRDELEAFLRAVDLGEAPIVAVGRAFENAVVPTFRVVSGAFRGWEIDWFNDAQSFDYIEEIRAPDGRKADFDDMFRLEDEDFAEWGRSYLFDHYEPNEQVYLSAKVVPE